MKAINQKSRIALLVASFFVIVATCVMMTTFSPSAFANNSNKVTTHLDEVNLDIIGDRNAQPVSDYVLNGSQQEGYSLEIITSGWEFSGTASATTYLRLNCDNGTWTLSNLDISLGSGGLVFMKSGTIIVPSGTIFSAEGIGFHSDAQRFTFAGSGKVSCNHFKGRAVTINGPELTVNNISNQEYAVNINGGGLNIKSGKLIIENHFPDAPWGVIIDGGCLNIEEGAEFFCNSLSGPAVALLENASISCSGMVGSVSSVSYENRSLVKDSVSLVEIEPPSGNYFICVNGDINTPAQTVLLRDVSPEPVPEPAVSETAQTGDSMGAIATLCIMAIAASAGYILSRKFRKYN